MNLFHSLRLHNLTAPSALDVVCSTETMAEIIDAFTPQQLVVAALLIDGMMPAEIARELGESIQFVCYRRKAARERVARTMYHRNAEHLLGDVLSRRWKSRKLQDYHKDRASCPDCGRAIHARSTRCQPCAQIERRRKEMAA